jgi:hypothetical protein
VKCVRAVDFVAIVSLPSRGPGGWETAGVGFPPLWRLPNSKHNHYEHAADVGIGGQCPCNSRIANASQVYESDDQKDDQTGRQRMLLERREGGSKAPTPAEMSTATFNL